MDEQAVDPTKPDVIAAVARELIRHENDLVNQRLTWLIQSQGLLFAAIAFAWEREALLPLMLSVLGIATAVSVGAALSMYSPAVKDIRDWWADRVSAERTKDLLVIGKYDPPAWYVERLRPWSALPVIFVTAWILVLAVKILSLADLIPAWLA